MVLSLQGCMAAGKTTAAAYLQAHMPGVHVSFESTADVIGEVRRRGLNKNVYEDYLEIQKLWIENEIARWERSQAYSCTVMDFGAEEIEFYTLNYPRSIGQEWAIEPRLERELAALRACMPSRILFLQAAEATLRRHKEKDETRSRTFFEHYVRRMMPLKRAWFAGKDNVDALCVDGLSPDEMGEQVQRWVETCMRRV